MAARLLQVVVFPYRGCSFTAMPQTGSAALCFFLSLTSVVRYSRRRWSNGGKGTDARHFVKN